WLRVPFAPGAIDVVLAAAGIGGYALGIAVLARWLAARVSKSREAIALAALLVGSIAVQAVAQSGAPAGYGLAKWVLALHQKGSSGYFSIARNVARDPWRF